MRMTQWIEPSKLVPIVCVLAIAGAALYSVAAPEPKHPELDALVGETVTLEGKVVRDPDKREKTTHLTVEVEEIPNLSINRKVRMLVYADRFAEVSYGDRVSVTGKLQEPEPFETDNDRTFDYPKYLLAHGITHTVSFPEVEVTARGEGNLIVATLLSLKHFLVGGIKTALPEPESALLAGLLIGEKQSLGEDITEAFRNAGVVHIIVLSGYNVALVINAISFVVDALLPRAAALGTAGIAVIAFAIMTGASETTIRASVMALIVLLARFLHRPSDGIRILLIAAAGMALWNPYLVLYDLSYQLSILATLGLILFSDFFASKMPMIPKSFGLREIVATTIATQVTVLPLLVLSVGSVSVVALFSNVLVLPAVPVAMLSGFLAALVAGFSWAFALPFTFLAYVILHYIIEVSVFFGELPFSAIPIPAEWTWPTLLILAAAYAAAFYVYSKRKER
jgi:competence protein ComEC